jgi:hypothetical protein
VVRQFKLKLFQNKSGLMPSLVVFECEEPSYIRFTVVDAYDNINYLKFKKAKEKCAFFSDVVKIGA